MPHAPQQRWNSPALHVLVHQRGPEAGSQPLAFSCIQQGVFGGPSQGSHSHEKWSHVGPPVRKDGSWSQRRHRGRQLAVVTKQSCNRITRCLGDTWLSAMTGEFIWFQLLGHQIPNRAREMDLVLQPWLLAFPFPWCTAQAWHAGGTQKGCAE